MREINFTDMDAQQVRLQLSSSARPAVRIYINNDGTEKKPEDIQCIHLSIEQARIMISGLQDLLCEFE